MSYTETIRACANIGLDPAFTAHVALQRCAGNLVLAAIDLGEGWTTSPPAGGWAHYLDRTVTPPDGGEPVITTNPPANHGAAQAILAQWANATTQTPTPTMP